VFRTISRLLLPNRLDWLCKRQVRRGGKKILLGWNRGLGDIALGLYAIVQRIRFWIPDASITFLVRENLLEGFSLLASVEAIPARGWKRGEPYDVEKSLREIGRDPQEFDLIIPWPSPTDWVRWQRGHLIPKLSWKSKYDELWKKFDLPEEGDIIGVQASAETNYGLWRNWPQERWQDLFDRIQSRAHVLLFGFGREIVYRGDHLIDLRGKTTLFELLSIIKNRCTHLIAPDSGVLSMAYYLDAAFPLRVVSLWADPNHGILKQNVASPNSLLSHQPLIGAHRDASTIGAEEVVHALWNQRC